MEHDCLLPRSHTRGHGRGAWGFKAQPKGGPTSHHGLNLVDVQARLLWTSQPWPFILRRTSYPCHSQEASTPVFGSLCIPPSTSRTHPPTSTCCYWTSVTSFSDAPHAPGCTAHHALPSGPSHLSLLSRGGKGG